ncbi:MAG: hypothetical protein CM15mP9_5920 [Methanobacteriota archaeon]|nr:MAG: hypothetical protein CM15mP9_5920 [Euryarchaeota archaeon]
MHEVHDEFLLECQPMIKDGMIEAQVSFVPKDEVNFELEIKAVTTHEFAFRQVEKGETITSDWDECSLIRWSWMVRRCRL